MYFCVQAAFLLCCLLREIGTELCPLHKLRSDTKLQPVNLSPSPQRQGRNSGGHPETGSAKGSSETRHLAKGRNEIPHPVLLTGTRFRASVQSGSTKNINFWIFQRHAPTQRASVRLCTVFSCAGRVLSRGAGRTAYKGVQRAEMLRNVEVFKNTKKGRRCRLPFVCCVLMLRVPQAVWKAAGAFPVLLPALRR